MVAVDERELNTTSTTGTTVDDRAGCLRSSEEALWSLCRCVETFVGRAIQPNSRIYVTQDANWDVTALIGYDASANTWGVTERFVYSPYGTATVLSPTFTAQGDQFNWQYMYQGGRADPSTGLYWYDSRNYSPSLGTWISQDPAGYINGADTYQFVGSDPVGAVDPLGLWHWYEPWTWPIFHSSPAETSAGAAVPGQGSPFLTNPRYRPPGWNPAWRSGVDKRGPYTQDPESGAKYYPHEEDRGHWPHYDTDTGERYPEKCKKPWPGQRRSPYDDQSKANPWDEIGEGGGDGAASGSVWGDFLGDFFGPAAIILATPFTLGSNDIIKYNPTPRILPLNPDFPGEQWVPPPDALRGSWA